MGYMTTITIRNDGFDSIKKNPEEFIKAIEEGMNGVNKMYLNEKGEPDRKSVNDYSVGYHSNPLCVALSHHANIPRLYIVHENMMNIIGSNSNLSEKRTLELRKRELQIIKDIINQEEEEIKRLEQK